MGFSADIDIAGGGAGSSLSVNGGKTDLNADYQAVGEQSGIFTGDGGLDLTASGKTTLIGGAITTTEAARDAGRNNYESLGGIETKEIENTTSYDGDAISVGVSVGNTTGKPQAQMNGIGYGSDGDSDSSVTRAGITGIAGNKDITTDNRAEYAGILENVFDETRVNEELGAQVEITQAFDQERRKVKTEINAKEKKLRGEAEEASNAGDYETAREKFDAADNLVNQGLLFDAVAGAIYGPNSNGATGYVAKAVSPAVSFKVGQYYKELEANQDNKLTGGQQAGHILAHTLLGAAVSYATGNDVLTGSVSAGTGEAAAPLLSQLLYEKDTDKLTAEQKDTISSIVSALGAGIGATTGNASDAANAAETSKVAAENNDGGPQTYGQSKAELMKETWEMNNGPIGKLLNKNQKYILIGTDFLPVIGDIKGVEEAEGTGDYIFAAVGLIPWGGDLLQKAHKAKKAEDKYEEAKAAGSVQGMKEAAQEGVDILKSQGKASEATGSQIIKKVESGKKVKPVLSLPSPSTAAKKRYSPGKAYSSKPLNEIKEGERWISTTGEATFPKQIADKMSGRSYNNFDEFRNDFWKAAANDPVLSKQFNKANLTRMRRGNAPFAPQDQQVGGRKSFELDHNIEIQDNGLVYDFGNIVIRDPKNHISKTSEEIKRRR
jgi:hypothetical protein